MTPDHCAQLLRHADPDRFASVMTADAGDRPRLATLYAANLEIAQAAVASSEPLISQMRLQWWDDQIAMMAEGRAPVGHEIATPLFAAWGSDIAPLAALIEARRRDALREPFADEGEVIAHVSGCTGTLTAMAAGACGLVGQDELIRRQALGAGLAGWLGAYPKLRALNMGLMPESPDQLAGLARKGIAALDEAAALGRKVSRRAAPALYAGAGSRRILQAAARGEASDISGFRRNLSHVALAMFGRWQG
ncbi:MAG: squalene/phytoene synthase family protein [Paracoccus sp. (in: a-proteobacteria)]